MISTSFNCDYPDCPNTMRVVLSGDQVFSGIRVRETYPHGWTIRTPKQGIVAIAYCPDHRNGRFQIGDHR